VPIWPRPRAVDYLVRFTLLPRFCRKFAGLALGRPRAVGGAAAGAATAKLEIVNS